MAPESTRHPHLPEIPAFARYRREILGGVILVIVVAVVYAWATNRQRHADQAAAAAIHVAQSKVESQAGTVDSRIEAFAAIRNEHPNSRPVWEAFAFEYGLDREAERSDAAIAVALAFLERHATHQASSRFAISAAKLRAAKGEYDEAEKLIADSRFGPDDPTAPERLFLRAQIHERRANQLVAAGNAEAARAQLDLAEVAYGNLVNLSTERNWSPEVRRIAEFARVVVRDRIEGKTHASPEPEALSPFGPQLPSFDLPSLEGAGDETVEITGTVVVPEPAATEAETAIPAVTEAETAAPAATEAETAAPAATEAETAAPAAPAPEAAADDQAE